MSKDAKESAFDQAVKRALKLPSNVSDEDKLSLYGLYKQAALGDGENSAKIFCLLIFYSCICWCCYSQY
jgi:acyl-CoA-binding protein